MRILICEDSALLREGIARLLEDAGHTMVGILADDGRLDRLVAETDPDLVILDVRLPPGFTDEGIRAALRLRATDPGLAVLVLSQYVEERYASELISSSRGGLGYLLKDRVADVEQFLAGVDNVAAGGTVLDSEVVAQLLARKTRDARFERLTPRESEVLGLMAEGRSNHAIAEALHVSAGSIEKHISAVFQKLELDQGDGGNRRVLAVLAHLDGQGHSPRSNPQTPLDGQGHAARFPNGELR
ncbi:DNA-binding NarL/FixJ family response regulator [Pseudoclavibacter sp. JAI123]|uniref:response regulator n=1 Tax=Pseudoclavibacter sp. JAI123 TaxID=2723065 RepID=UPI0015C75791|nr:response regulator transcription factor [Pseudoclavibacter sp. JAI123]NYF14592.1 DNA-binding NarL/FixJ family response regulator [Pseudoclavibacter sp. JAI123]